MQNDSLTSGNTRLSDVKSRAMRQYALDSLSRYWPSAPEMILMLPSHVCFQPDIEPLPPVTLSVKLPEWAATAGVEGKILVPAFALRNYSEPQWKEIDWLAAAAWYIIGAAERAFERENGPIYSYSSRLVGWNADMWDYAWSNRIALFLRMWTARESNRSEESIFGPRPKPEIILTHDVDALAKGFDVRFRRGAFMVYNAVSNLLKGKSGSFMKSTYEAGRFCLSGGNYRNLAQIARMEENAGLRSHFYLYSGFGDGPNLSIGRIIDPAYSISSPELIAELKSLRGQGFTIGLHPSFDSWESAEKLGRERNRLEKAIEAPVTCCRQHWLRFSWLKTWKAQEEAGLLLDTTLGFNDRPGFRNSSALRFHPWRDDDGVPSNIEAMPMIVMDSHFYNYNDRSLKDALPDITRWLGEVMAVGGVATVLWHNYSISEDYGGPESYVRLLDIVKKL